MKIYKDMQTVRRREMAANVTRLNASIGSAIWLLDMFVRPIESAVSALRGVLIL